MGNINSDFNVPYYIFEEIVEYCEQTAQRKMQDYEMGKYKKSFKLCKSQR